MPVADADPARLQFVVDRAARLAASVSVAGNGDERRGAAAALFIDAHGLVRAVADAGGPGHVAERIVDSVLRPLATGLAGDGAAPAREIHGSRVDIDEAVWALAQAATELRARLPSDDPLTAYVAEATACLQQLALERTPDRLGRLRELQAGLSPGIQVALDGPYLVTGAERVRNWLGESIEVPPMAALCRCGLSKIKPFCDGAHAEAGFSGDKDPKRVEDRRDTYVGQQITILDNRGTCQHAGYCSDRLASAFRLDREPFVAPSGGRMDEIIRAVRDCPSGALSYALDGVEARDAVDRHGSREPAIEVTRDGPYRITGAFPLSDERGRPVARNAGASPEHYALCRCGHSQNKPFCSGMHWYVDFKDPLPGPDHEPTIFEWAGGLPALTRMTRLFYEKHVPQDPLLAPLFADMSADHPERVAKWLGEVFCGPRDYSEQFGGYKRMVSQHLGKRAHRGATRPLGSADAAVRRRGRPAERPRVPLGVRLLPRVGLAAGRGELASGRQATPGHADAALGLEHRGRVSGRPDLRPGAGVQTRPRARSRSPKPESPSASSATSSRSSASATASR